MRLLIMGPQGVGKGTQAALLSEHYGIPAISTGDIFRYNIKNKTELGVEALKYIDKGELVPDELTNKIVLMERMKKRAEIEGRSDDTPEAIAKRLDVYAKETAPLLDIYQKRGLLKTFNGVGAVDEIQATIVAELG